MKQKNKDNPFCQSFVLCKHDISGYVYVYV